MSQSGRDAGSESGENCDNFALIAPRDELPTISGGNRPPPLALLVHSAVTRAYEKVPNRGKALPHTGEWSVLSAIVCEEPSNKEFWVVSMATGSKCCGPGVINSSSAGGYVLHDSHAEVLAKRAFTYALLEEMRNGHGRLLERSSSKFSLRGGIKFHLYISESPCGDATIYNLSDGSCASSSATMTNFTGAKAFEPISAPASAASESLASSVPTASPIREPEEQSLSCLRLKSGRSNIPTPKRSLSHCCSDKIVRWCKLGLSGALTKKLMIKDAFLSSVVVSPDPRLGSCTDSQEDALARAITRRGGCDVHVLPPSLLPVPWSFGRIAKQQQQAKHGKVSASGVSINYVYLDDALGKGGSPFTELTVGATGLKQGAGGKKRKGAPNGVLPPPPSSRLCRRELLSLAARIINHPLPSHDGAAATAKAKCTYDQAKREIAGEAYTKSKDSLLEMVTNDRRADSDGNPLRGWCRCTAANNFDL